MNLADALDIHARARPTHLALIDGARRIPYAEVAAIVGSAWAAATSQAASARSAPSADASEQTSAPQGLAEPAMAGR